MKLQLLWPPALHEAKNSDAFPLPDHRIALENHVAQTRENYLLTAMMHQDIFREKLFLVVLTLFAVRGMS